MFEAGGRFDHKNFLQNERGNYHEEIIAFALAACLCLALAVSASADGSVYYLNFKPEQDAQWQELAKLYTEQTGVPGDRRDGRFRQL